MICVNLAKRDYQVPSKKSVYEALSENIPCFLFSLPSHVLVRVSVGV